jgi:hypothetical protein
MQVECITKRELKQKFERESALKAEQARNANADSNDLDFNHSLPQRQQVNRTGGGVGGQKNEDRLADHAAGKGEVR